MLACHLHGNAGTSTWFAQLPIAWGRALPILSPCVLWHADTHSIPVHTQWSWQLPVPVVRVYMSVHVGSDAHVGCVCARCVCPRGLCTRTCMHVWCVYCVHMCTPVCVCHLCVHCLGMYSWGRLLSSAQHRFLRRLATFCPGSWNLNNIW